MSVAPQIAAPLSQSPAGRSTALRVTTAERTRARPGYSVLYSFIGGSGDGGYPIGDLLNVNGTLYGTTAGQGAHGVGTVFAITVSGKETVLYSFGTNSEDGTNPIAGLINVNGTLYGTTENGGSNGYGTVFAITMSGKETVLYSFGTSSEDGTSPFAGLIDVNGTLYGTTVAGGVNCRSGSSGCGTVFAITTSGKETVLHSFGGSGDGDGPVAALINVKGTLYGTTLDGPYDFCGESGCGTVFSITPSGKETVLHSFGSSGDGTNPLAGLINLNGMLYGTTGSGGAKGDGTVFAITMSGKETVLYSFGTGSEDGDYPVAGLTNVKGTLYGTTEYGAVHCSKGGGCGTVFSITTSGTETVLYRFKRHSSGTKDGAHPQAGVINVNGTLYGTTNIGGVNRYGTVFSLSP
jgi:uncharacterized repeat protein (TIGR03803 family)